MAYALQAIATCLALLLAGSAFSAAKDFRKAGAMGLPAVFVPVDQTQVLWIIIAPTLRGTLQRLLPAWLWRRVSLSIFGWEFHEGLRPFDFFVPGHCRSDGVAPSRTFAVVGLRQMHAVTADPVAANDMIRRVRDLELPHSHAYALGPYGASVLSTNGDRWAMHRKIITGVIDERISRAVFDEAVRQASGLLQEVFPSSASASPEDRHKASANRSTPSEADETRLLFDMLKRVTIHVLLGASMGARVPWNASNEPLEPGYTMTHIASLTTMVINLVGIGLLPPGLLKGWPRWLPWHELMQTVGHAKAEVYTRSKAILEGERVRRRRHLQAEEHASNAEEEAEAVAADKPRPNIKSKLLHASEAEGELALTEDEMISNLFAVTAAGFETTLTTLSYAMVLLARYPHWQNWLLEEIDELSPLFTPLPADASTVDGARAAADKNGAGAGRGDSCYHAVFPRATRTGLHAGNAPTLQPCPTRGARNARAAEAGHVHRDDRGARRHAHLRGLGGATPAADLAGREPESDPPFVSQKQQSGNQSDELTFRPSRWFTPPGSGASTTLYHPPKGTWLPWSMDPRVCPGQKMAQVEFAGVLLTLLRRHRVEAVPLKGENRT